MALTRRPLDEAVAAPSDDYLIEAEQQQERTPVTVRVLRVAQIIMFGVVAVLTLAVFWMIGLVLGIL